MTDDITLRVRHGLGTNYRTMALDPAQTARVAVDRIASNFGIAHPEEYTVYIPPRDEKTKGLGVWMEGYQTLSSQNLRSQDVIELKKFPQQLNLCLSDGTDQWAANFVPSHTDSYHVIKFDWSDPLLELLPTADRLFKLRKGEHYTFQVMSSQSGRQSVQWLNANLSLEEQDVPVDSFVVVVPVSSLNKRNAESQLNPTVDGFLQKMSIKEGKSTALKKRYCVMSDNFLFYYKQQSGSPSGVVPLEYYNVLRNDEGGRCGFTLEYAKGSGMLAKSPTYVMTAENAREREAWVAAIRRICYSGAGKNVFGVSLVKLLSRKDQKLDVPVLVKDAIHYLDKPEIHTLEGIFRISGSASLIAKYKQDYDTGKDVDLSSCPAPHVVSGLLKMYLRELPEPLLTFDFFQPFLATLEDPANGLQQMKEMISQLPLPNYNLIKLLLPFLHVISQHADVNLMPATNLATVFGPNLLRDRGDNMLAMVQATPAINAVTQTLIEKQEILLSSAPIKPKEEWAEALYDYKATSEQELSFKKGDVIKILTKLESGWLHGELKGAKGMVPQTYVQLGANPPPETVAWGSAKAPSARKSIKPTGLALGARQTMSVPSAPAPTPTSTSTPSAAQSAASSMAQAAQAAQAARVMGPPPMLGGGGVGRGQGRGRGNPPPLNPRGGTARGRGGMPPGGAGGAAAGAPPTAPRTGPRSSGGAISPGLGNGAANGGENGSLSLESLAAQIAQLRESLSEERAAREALAAEVESLRAQLG
mmetsp:Transcript_17832/g.45388  ORF Transcript_17832/g.45388 Transcript_17832/m.45388 type:complete len:758 (-) Transcript_17832:168-2441(-)